MIRCSIKRIYRTSNYSSRLRILNSSNLTLLGRSFVIDPLPSQLFINNISIRHFAKQKKNNKQNIKLENTNTQDNIDEDDDDDLDGSKKLESVNKAMHGALQNFKRACAQMRPGKADAGIFDDVQVQVYGSYVPLAQVAQVSVAGDNSLTLTIYDPSVIKDVRNAIENVNPIYSIRESGPTALDISFPKLSGETRVQLQKGVKKQAEAARQHVRRVRQDAMSFTKKKKDTDGLSEDSIKVQLDAIQKVTDSHIKEIDNLLQIKERELSE